MRSSRCNHQLSPTSQDLQSAMEERILNIKKFQEEMPASRVNIDSAILERWDLILKDFDEQLKNAEHELNELKKELYK